jgi:DNA-binding response OmpR family regulator
LKIIVSGNDSDSREMINFILKKEGFNTVIAKNRQDFFDKIHAFRPDIILYDTDELRLNILKDMFKPLNYQKNIRCIVLSFERCSEEEKHFLKKWNIIDHIRKPVDIENLMNVIKKYAL